MGRRPNYEGVRVASRSSIEICFYYQGKKHRERVKAKPTPSNLLKAYNFRQEVVESIKAGTFEYYTTFPDSKRAEQYCPTTPSTVEVVLNRWLDDQEQYLKTSTWDGYSKIIKNQLIPVFGSIPVHAITRKDVKDWVRNNKKGVSNKTIGNIISPLRCALDDAVEEYELIDVNPIADWRIKRKRGKVKNKDNIDPYDYDERMAILETLDGQAKNMINFWFWTGLRTSELIALDWADIDFIHNKIRINKALTQAAKEAELPKTKAADRYIELLAPALDALKQQKQYTYNKNQEVFQNPRTKERWTGDAPIRKTMWIHALKKAGVRYRYPYQCRHTYATMMLDANENIRWISSQLGHTDWTFTAKTYTRFMPQSFENAGKKAVEKFG